MSKSTIAAWSINSVVAMPCDRRPHSAWEHFHNNITQYELYATPSTRSWYVDELLKNMATLPIIGVDEMVKKGTQIKLVLKLTDGTTMLFKPMRLLPAPNPCFTARDNETAAQCGRPHTG